ncbi:MAG: vanadium-dependent haloperoxidase [Pseudomonadota bacterium]
MEPRLTKSVGNDKEDVGRSPDTHMVRESGVNRRALLQAPLAAAAVAAALTGCERSAAQSSTPTPMPTPTPTPTPPGTPTIGGVFGDQPMTRSLSAAALKTEAANRNANASSTTQQTINTDEADLPDFIGSFSKTLLHNSEGEVDQLSYLSYLQALASGDPDDFEAITVGNPTLADRIGLVSPQSAYAFELLGLDGQASRMPPAPTFSSAETAAEMVELYWYALCRDVPFANYETDPLINAAVTELNALSRSDIFPTISGAITPQTVFRSSLPGATTGPFLSQFLLQPFFLGAYEIDQRYRRVAEGSINNFMTSFTEYLAIQNGAPPIGSLVFDQARTFLYSLRQLGEFVHVDLPTQSGLYAATILFNLGATDQSLPLQTSATQDGFVDFGKADIGHLVTKGPRHALTAAWYQKWLAHRRVRPEAFACRINVQQRGLRTYPINADVLGSDALARINAANPNAGDQGLLPMGYPEGSPAHPAYPGGHSSFIAAAATICKGFFDEDFVFPNPVQPSVDGQTLEPWTGEPLTVLGELNKLVGNITHGRDGAGMHYRSDGLGNFIGEEVGLSILRDYAATYNQEFSGFTVTRFNGDRVMVSA